MILGFKIFNDIKILTPPEVFGFLNGQTSITKIISSTLKLIIAYHISTELRV